jgi:hypothetical protein
MMTKISKSTKQSGSPVAAGAPATSKLDRLLAELAREDGVTIDQLVGATGWQKHSVRGAMAGALKRKGHQIASTKADGVRRYRLVPAA